MNFRHHNSYRDSKHPIWHVPGQSQYVCLLWPICNTHKTAFLNLVIYKNELFQLIKKKKLEKTLNTWSIDLHRICFILFQKRKDVCWKKNELVWTHLISVILQFKKTTHVLLLYFKYLQLFITYVCTCTDHKFK